MFSRALHSNQGGSDFSGMRDCQERSLWEECYHTEWVAFVEVGPEFSATGWQSSIKVKGQDRFEFSFLC